MSPDQIMAWTLTILAASSLIVSTAIVYVKEKRNQ